MLPDVLFGGPARMHQAVLQLNRRPFRVLISSNREDFLFISPQDICSERVAVHFGASQESIDDMESEWIPYDCEHELLCVNIGPRLCSDVISGEGPHSAWRIGQKELRLISGDQMMPAVSRRSY
jgi:hypothetical protein